MRGEVCGSPLVCRSVFPVFLIRIAPVRLVVCISLIAKAAALKDKLLTLLPLSLGAALVVGPQPLQITLDKCKVESLNTVISASPARSNIA